MVVGDVLDLLLGVACEYDLTRVRASAWYCQATVNPLTLVDVVDARALAASGSDCILYLSL